MCFEYILVVSQQCSYIKCRRQCNLAHLRSAPPLLYPSLSLWASGTVSMWSTKQILFPLLLPKVHLASGFVQKTRQPLLRSLKTSPSLTPPVRLGRVEVLVFSFLTYSTYSPLCNNHSLESHAITVTAPVKLHVVVIYRPPGQLAPSYKSWMACCPHYPRMAVHL